MKCRRHIIGFYQIVNFKGNGRICILAKTSKKMYDLTRNSIETDSKYDLHLQMLRFVKTIMLFSQKNVDVNAISCNKLLLLHGPPGNIHLTLHRIESCDLMFAISFRHRQNEPVQGTGTKGRHSNGWTVRNHSEFASKQMRKLMSFDFSDTGTHIFSK